MISSHWKGGPLNDKFCYTIMSKACCTCEDHLLENLGQVNYKKAKKAMEGLEDDYVLVYWEYDMKGNLIKPRMIK